MTRRPLVAMRLAASLLLIVGAFVATLAAFAVRAGAQTQNVAVTCPACESRVTVTPAFVVFATGFAGGGPYRYTLEVSQNALFTGSLDLDTTFTSPAATVTVLPTTALSDGARLWYRATVTDAAGNTGRSSIIGPFLSAQWVRLVSPPTIAGQPERTLQPRFVWRAASVNEPPGPWSFTLIITSRNGTSQFLEVGSDTSFTPSRTLLEANAAYTWSVRARLRNGQAGTFPQSVSFTTEDTTLAVTSTQFYLPFPNPFPYVIGADEQNNGATCLWFDLKNSSTVSIDVYTYRGAHVRRLVPNAQLAGMLDAGRYGRGRGGTNESCDARIRWDGRDDRGNDVPEGVYLIRFRADGIDKKRKVTFRGR